MYLSDPHISARPSSPAARQYSLIQQSAVCEQRAAHFNSPKLARCATEQPASFRRQLFVARLSWLSRESSGFFILLNDDTPGHRRNKCRGRGLASKRSQKTQTILVYKWNRTEQNRGWFELITEPNCYYYYGTSHKNMIYCAVYAGIMMHMPLKSRNGFPDRLLPVLCITLPSLTCLRCRHSCSCCCLNFELVAFYQEVSRCIHVIPWGRTNDLCLCVVVERKARRRTGNCSEQGPSPLPHSWHYSSASLYVVCEFPPLSFQKNRFKIPQVPSLSGGGQKGQKKKILLYTYHFFRVLYKKIIGYLRSF